MSAYRPVLAGELAQRLSHLNGLPKAQVEFEDYVLVRHLRACHMSQLIDRRVQIRTQADDGYTISFAEASALPIPGLLTKATP